MTTASTKKKYPRADAIAVAKELVALLRPACEPERLVVAGSLRRWKRIVSDVEIVYVSKIVEQVNHNDLFAPPTKVSAVDRVLEDLLLAKSISKRPSKLGHFTYGPKNKLCVHCASGIPVDFFSTSLSCWPMTLFIRTGPKDFNLKIIEFAMRRGLKLHAYGDGFTDQEGNNITAVSEEHIFKLAGMKYLPPHARF